MPQGNNPGDSPTTPTTGARTPAPKSQGAGERDAETSMTRGAQTGGAAAAPAESQGISAQAQQYGQKVADAATQAKDYVADKMTVVGDKFKDLQNKDISQVAEEAKQYARQNPGQAILISAAAGLILGLLFRGSRR